MVATSLRRILQQIWLNLTAVFLACWRFTGRVGLAFRQFLLWVVWKPLVFITLPFWLPIRWLFWDYMKKIVPPIWRFIGQVGQAIRQLIWRFVWQPIYHLLIRPVRWYLRDILVPGCRWLYRQTGRLLRAIWGKMGQAWAFIMGKTAPRRALWRKKYGSRWHLWRARWRLAFKRPSPPEKAELAPSQPRLVANQPNRLRLATAVAAVSLLLLVAILSLNDRNSNVVVADSATPITIILTPTPLPPTRTPVPTLEIMLTPWVTPDPTTGGGAIAFAQTVNGNSDIYLLPMGQTEPVRVTTHPAADRDPVWSPDGSRFAFASNRDGDWELYIYHIAEERLQRLTNNPFYDGAPAWSPDGQWLVYESYQNNNLDIYLIKADGSEGPFRLTSHPAADYAPAWSPQGRHIAYTSWRSGNKDIFLQSLDGNETTAVNITQSPAVQEDGVAFSPDGRFLAYFNDQPGFPVLTAQPLNQLLQADGPPLALGHQGRSVTWSPDSQSLVYVHEKDGRYYLVAGSAEAWGVTPQLFTAVGPLGKPSWVAIDLSPDQAQQLANIDNGSEESPLFVEALARPVRNQPPVTLFELPVNAPSPYLSDEVDQSFLALRQRVIDEAGWDFLGQLDGMFESLESKPLPGQPAQSWNKAGRAFDFYYREALGLSPRVLVVREDNGPDTYWRVYLRTAVQDGSQGEPLKTIYWDFNARTGDDPQYYEQGGKWADAVPTGYYVDFTALAAMYGWERVPANANWRTYFPDIRFWHFENRAGLSWDEAMRRIYSEAELSGTP